MYEQAQGIRVQITSNWLRQFILKRGGILNVATGLVIIG